MKKKLITLISFVLAVVMCLACIACGDDEATNNASTSAAMSAVGRVVDGAQKLAYSDSFKMTVEGNITSGRTYSNSSLSSDNYDYNEAIDMTVSKNGDWLRIDGVSQYPGYMNLGTGYFYGSYGYYDSTQDKYVYTDEYSYDSSMPAGLINVYKNLISDEVKSLQSMSDAGLAWLDNYITYDSRAKKVVVDFDLGSKVSDVLSTIYDNADGDVNALLNALLADRYTAAQLRDSTPVNLLLDELLSEFDKNKNKTIGDLISIIEQDTGMSLEQILSMVSMPEGALDKTTLNKIKARKLGEIVAAALKLAESTNITTEDVFNKLFIDKVTVPSDLKSQLSAYKPFVVQMLSQYPVSELARSLDMYPTVYRYQPLFGNLKGHAEISFDNSGVLRGVTATYNIEYSENYYDYSSYDEPTANGRKTDKYTGAISGEVQSLPASEKAAVEFDKSKISADARMSSYVMAVANETSNASIYFEKGKRDISLNLSGATAYYVDTTEEQQAYNPYHELNIANKLTYSASASTFTLDKSVIAGLVRQGHGLGTSIYIEVPLTTPIEIDRWETIDSIHISITYIPNNLSISDMMTTLPTYGM